MVLCPTGHPEPSVNHQLTTTTTDTAENFEIVGNQGNGGGSHVKVKTAGFKTAGNVGNRILNEIKAISPKGENPSSPKDKMDFDERVKSLTEITTKNTSKTTTIPPTEKSESHFQNSGKVGSRVLESMDACSFRSVGEVGKNILKNGRQKKTTDLPVTVRGDPISSGLELVFDFSLKDWTDMQKHRASKMLKGVPNSDKQMVLDELNSAVAKGTVKQVWAWLANTKPGILFQPQTWPNVAAVPKVRNRLRQQ